MVEWKTLHIANLNFSAQMDGLNYRIDNQIISEGFFNKIYPFKLKSSTLGVINNNSFLPETFKYVSQSKKKTKKIELIFDKSGFVNRYKISPPPEVTYIDNFEILKLGKFFIDPVSQLFQFFLYQTSANRTIIDGRRIYDLKANSINGRKFDNIESLDFNGETSGLKITFPYYRSLWKDPKEDINDMEYVKFYYSKFNNTNIPVQIVIKTKKVKVFLNLSSYNIVN